MQAEQVFNGTYKDYMAVLGLGNPWVRGAVAAAATAGVTYAMRYPQASFHGTRIRPLDKLSTSPEAVPLRHHFLLTPLVVGVGVAAFS